MGNKNKSLPCPEREEYYCENVCPFYKQEYCSSTGQWYICQLIMKADTEDEDE